jgi:hypothetical protein
MSEVTNDSKQVLRFMLQSKVCDGAALIQLFSGDGQRAVDALRPLIDEGLLETNSIAFDAKTLPRTFFNLNFSSMSKARTLAS